MSALLGFFLIILALVLVVGFSIINGILRLLFGFGRKRNYQRNTGTGHSAGQNKETVQNNDQDQTAHKKIFDEDEGEYVDFEEVKEDDKK